MVLGRLMEENLRRALLISRGDWSVFLTRPLSAVLMAIAAFLLVLALLPSLRKKRDEVFVESENCPACGGPPQVEVCSAPGEMLNSKCRPGRAGIFSNGRGFQHELVWSLACEWLSGWACRADITFCARAGSDLSDAQHHHDRAVRGR